MPLLGREKVSRMTDEAYVRINNNVRGVFIGGLFNIMEGTPVGLTQGEVPKGTKSTSGLTKNNWFLSVGTPSSSVTSSKAGGLASIRQLQQMPKGVLNKKIFYTNNKPNILTLEYGVFPNPVKKGSRLKGGDYTKLSSGGFSNQASNGWIRKTLKAMANKIRSL